MSRTTRPAPTVEAFLAAYPEPVASLAEQVRHIVVDAVPGVVEAVYPGWKLIGYRIPRGKKSHYFGFVAPLQDHVALGFEYGVQMDDPAGLLEGTGKQVRQIRIRTPGDIREALFRDLILQAAIIAARRQDHR